MPSQISMKAFYHHRPFYVVGMALVAVILIAGAVFLYSVIRDTPPLTEYEPTSAGPVVYDRHGLEIGRLAEETRVHVSLDSVPEHLIHALIATEDRSFFRHRGVDLRGILRAGSRNVRALGIVEGASTITQQLARTLYLSRERTLRRKISEIYLAVQMERRYSKNQIIEMYLNEVYFGAGAYGIEAASQRYFEKSVSDLELHESALLVGLLRAPSQINPFRNPAAARSNRQRVLLNMIHAGFLTEEQAADAVPDEVDFADPYEREPGDYIIQHVRDLLLDDVDRDVLYGADLEIHTTFDLEKQEIAAEAIRDAFNAGTLPTVEDGDEPIQAQQPQAAMVSVDAETGELRVLLGGRHGDTFNRAQDTARQPGSAIKPFVYATAVSEGRVFPGTIINDMPLYEHDEEDDVYVVWPRNFDSRYHGLVSLREAMALSVNVPAVRVARELGIPELRTGVEDFGFTTLGDEDGDPDHDAFALGGLEHGVTVLEMASAFSVFANQGVRVEPVSIDHILDADGERVYEAEQSERRVLSEVDAYIMRDMLRTAVEEGTGARAALSDLPVAGKTGTTDLHTDAWFTGFSDQLVTSIWVGEDRALPMMYDESDDDSGYSRAEGAGDFEVLGVHASEVWADYQRGILHYRDTLPDVEDLDLPLFSALAELPQLIPEDVYDWNGRPDEVREVEVSTRTGLPLAVYPEVFPGGTVNELMAEDSDPDIMDAVPFTEAGQLLLGVGRTDFDGVFLPIYYERGPMTVSLGDDEHVRVSGGQIFRGTYHVADGEPVQIINPETGLPPDPESVRFVPVVSRVFPVRLPLQDV
ncbi:MAG: PBP1A family penicillin-binding protein [Spirochaetaceae bacterium]|nr:MAG: PBP1A family penicillin-binding protein [Spirochaetaceae bacterium]